LAIQIKLKKGLFTEAVRQKFVDSVDRLFSNGFEYTAQPVSGFNAMHFAGAK
jgi:hypothetical protein